MRLLHTSDWHWARIFTAKAARPNTTLFLTGYWTARRSMKSTPLSWLAIFLIPARRRATPANCITVSSSSCSRPAVAPVVLAGNHDSVAMLNESRDILAFYTPPWWRTPATRRLSCRCATARRAPSSVRCRFTPARAGDQPGRSLRSGKTAAAAARHQRLLSGAVSAGLRAARRSAAAHHCQRPSDHRRRQQKRCRPRHLHRHTGCLSGATLPPLPTTLRWAIFTGRRWSAAASISATAARRCR